MTIITDDQANQFRRHGYTIAPTFFTADEVGALRAEVERLHREGKFTNVARDGDRVTPTDTQANLQLIPTFPHSPLYRALPFAPKVLTAVDRLLGEPVMQHLCQIFLKPGNGVGLGTNWHQDNAYFRVSNPLMGTAMWIAIHETTVENGTMRLIPDSFDTLLEHTADPYSNHHIRCYPDESKAETVLVPPGGVAFFCYGTPHCTGQNNSPSERAGLAYHFLRQDFAPENVAPGPGHPILSGPDASGGKNEYGETIAGAWEAEVEKALG